MSNPWGDDTGEKMERMATVVAKPIKKAVSDVTRDVTDSFGLTDLPKQVPNDQKQQIKQDDQAKAAQIRQNIVKIDAQMTEIRKKREQQPVSEKEKNPPSLKLRKDKEKDSALNKIIKSQKGTKEGMQRVSG